MKALRLCFAFLLCSLVAVDGGAADPAKVLRVALEVDVTGFDPQTTSDGYSGMVCRNIFESLLEYDYLQRPYALKPSTAEALPEIRDGGRTLVFKVRPGIYFTPDPAFKGKPRELVAEDYVYSWKRILDPKVRSFWSFYLDGKLVGGDAMVAAANASGKFDYDAKLEGLQALDRYTLQVKLVQPDYLLLEYITQRQMAAVAREVIEAYGAKGNGWNMDHPVGTGPFMLKDWRRGSRITLVANPDYRDDRYPTVGPDAPATLRANSGKRLPLVGRVEVSIMEEPNPRLLAFNSQQIDYLPVPYPLADRVLENGKLRAEYARQGVLWNRILESAFTYTYFDMDDPVVGGYTPEKVALRRAVSMGYDVDTEIRVLRHGEAIPATQLIPPGLLGHDPKRNRHDTYDPVAAQALLDRFGYRRGADGYRTRPDGSPLMLSLGSPPDTEGREFDELWKRSMDAIGIRIEFVKQKWPELLKMSTAGKLQMFRLARAITLRDGGVALEILYSPSIDKGNNDSRFRFAEYDRLFDRARVLPDSPERTALYMQMTDLANVYMPIMLGTYRYRSVLAQPWLVGLKPDFFFREPWKYVDIDLGKRKAAQVSSR
jgi:ABC-type transport system substrate-binding protein